MKLQLQADWTESILSDSELIIGGYYAHAYSKGDYSAWTVKLSSFNVLDKEIAHGTADDINDAKDQAEQAIADHHGEANRE